MDNLTFTGRQAELKKLNLLLSKKTASLAVITGRRRIGKSRLVVEFARTHPFYHFTGLAPTKEISAQDQRDTFAQQLNSETGLPLIKADDWSKLFELLAEKTKQGRIIVLLDEISWMGSKDPTFLGKLKIAWDRYYNNNPHLVLILCGSVSTWIEHNIISSTNFFGRISLKLSLTELPIYRCNTLLDSLGFQGSNYEKFMLLAITGGVPWYIEQINPSLSAAKNIRRLGFEKEGLFVEEYQKIFHDLFGKRYEICHKIVATLANGAREYAEISDTLNYPSSGALSEYLDDLEKSGFISRDFTWRLKTGLERRISKYRLSDNYLRFYLKMILPNLSRINRNQFEETSLLSLPSWQTIVGLQFENLVLNNRKLIQAALHIKPQEIIADNPYFQRKTSRQQGCQIDYLIQTQFKTLYVCEVKFSMNKLGLSVVTQVKTKIARLSLPRGTACLPVLIHVNGITDELLSANYFSAIIDFSEFLQYKG